MNTDLKGSFRAPALWLAVLIRRYCTDIHKTLGLLITTRIFGSLDKPHAKRKARWSDTTVTMRPKKESLVNHQRSFPPMESGSGGLWRTWMDFPRTGLGDVARLCGSSIESLAKGHGVILIWKTK